MSEDEEWQHADSADQFAMMWERSPAITVVCLCIAFIFPLLLAVGFVQTGSWTCGVVALVLGYDAARMYGT